MKLEIGQGVRVIQPVIQGGIVDIRYNKDAGELEYLLEYVTGTDTHQRWFNQTQLEVI